MLCNLIIFILVEQLRKQVEEVKASMELNIDQVLERGDKLDELVEKSEMLNIQAEQFKVSLCCVLIN